MYGSTLSCRGGSAVSVFYEEKREELQDAVRTVCVDSICSGIAMEDLTGSITVEAALVVPILLFVFGIVMQKGIDLYTETKVMAVERMEEDDWDIIKEFKRRTFIEQIVE